MTKEFTRNIEDFECEKCGAQVAGNGYTNHCPECLTSKHVDVHPGDRAETCNGLMEPIEVASDANSYVLTHRCVKCNYTKKNKVAKNDNMENVIDLAQRVASKK